MLSAYARQNRSSAVFLGCEKPAADSDNTHRTLSLTDHSMPVGGPNCKVEGDCSVVPSTSIARGRPAHHSSTTPTPLPTTSWAGNIQTVYAIPPRYSEELLRSSPLSSHDQRSLALLTKSLAGWSSRHKESTSRTAKKDTTSGAKLRVHQRSLSLQSLSSAASGIWLLCTWSCLICNFMYAIDRYNSEVGGVCRFIPEQKAALGCSFQNYLVY